MPLNPKLLAPGSIAVVGASEALGKTGGKILHCAKSAGFAGPIYPVNPGGHASLQGLKAYATLDDLPEVPDLLLISIPGAGVPALIEDAARRGCAGAVVFSSDVVPADMARAVDVARRAGMSVLGPNTEGLYVPQAGLAATFAHVVEECIAHPPPAFPSRRRVAVVSQSGGIGFALFGRALAAHLDLRSVVTTGNEADLEVLDFVERLVEQGDAGVILLFIEGLKDARRFATVAQRAAERQVPIVVMKVGRSEAGQRAAISHTAHLAGADTAYDAAFERHGVLRVFDVEEMLAAAAALSLMPFMTGHRVAVVTTSGGAGGWAADLLSAQGLEIPALSAGLQQALMVHLPAYASAGNPVDTTVAATEQKGRAMLAVIEALATSGEVDAVLLNMGLSAQGRIDGMAPAMQPLLARCGVPVLFHSHITPSAQNLQALAAIGAHGFPSFRACASGLDALRRYGRFQQQRATAQPGTLCPPPGRSPLLEPGALADGVLGEAQTRELVSHYRIPMPPSALVQDAKAAMAAAQGMGFPVVLKIQSPDIAHKTEAGGVELHVGEDTLHAAYERLMRNVRQHAPHARLEGVQVQKMMPPGHEMVVGVVNDADFGPLVMLGFGGIYVEVLKDVVFAPPPIAHAGALRMVDRLKASAILKGARGRPPADLDALAGFIVAVSQLAADADGVIDQIDFNPVLVYPKGQGVVAVDALVATRPNALQETH
ncbi:acetate--CoA ligase family protein [Hydrogenophaga sp. BPS33]|uniref:acetate--CoA ligase family protein n=1 Tax=Hydrogenophaga sp. BPS33 TaxID=2651974 RepID=UPI00131F831A|nr:acetate--CoA ligase family protein [Hydrogenophaga sp. BPS33]QHE84604.1 acetate--CoA ligase family protein [Hydrogenophaga sp. BPS33]